MNKKTNKNELKDLIEVFDENKNVTNKTDIYCLLVMFAIITAVISIIVFT